MAYNINEYKQKKKNETSKKLDRSIREQEVQLAKIKLKIDNGAEVTDEEWLNLTLPTAKAGGFLRSLLRKPYS